MKNNYVYCLAIILVSTLLQNSTFVLAGNDSPGRGQLPGSMDNRTLELLSPSGSIMDKGYSEWAAEQLAQLKDGITLGKWKSGHPGEKAVKISPNKIDPRPELWGAWCARTEARLPLPDGKKRCAMLSFTPPHRRQTSSCQMIMKATVFSINVCWGSYGSQDLLGLAMETHWLKRQAGLSKGGLEGRMKITSSVSLAQPIGGRLHAGGSVRPYSSQSTTLTNLGLWLLVYFPIRASNSTSTHTPIGISAHMTICTSGRPTNWPDLIFA